MDYKKYISNFKLFNSPQGYIDACKMLAFKAEWKQFDSYKNMIQEQIEFTRSKLNQPINGADICCGGYAWLSRHFSDSFNKIYCNDLDQTALESKIIKNNPKCIPKIGDASKIEFETDFIFCGNNVYVSFIDNISKSTNPDGGIFLMKPINGDDLYFRHLIKNYNLESRVVEADNISSKLRNYFSINESMHQFEWSYSNVGVDKILAAISVVSLGEREIMTPQQYEKCMDYLLTLRKNNTITLAQQCKIWKSE